MGFLLVIGKALIWLALIIFAAAAGLLVCGFLGIFMGPAKLFEWTRNGNSDVSSDTI